MPIKTVEDWTRARFKREAVFTILGINRGTFDYWKNRGLFVPPSRGGGPIERETYSALDVAKLEVVKRLVDSAAADSFIALVTGQDGFLDSFLNGQMGKDELWGFPYGANPMIVPKSRLFDYMQDHKKRPLALYTVLES